MQSFLNYWGSLVEVINFGYNLTTFAAIMTFLFTWIGFWGLYRQNKMIWHNKNGLSIANDWMIISAYLYICAFIYGISQYKLAMICNGIIRGSISLPIIIGLIKFSGFNRREWATLGAMAIIIIGMLLVKNNIQGFFFLAIAIIAMLYTLEQPLKIYQNKSRGNVSLEMLVTYTISTVFWLTYAVAINDWFIVGFSGPSLFIFITTLYLWYKYPNKEIDGSRARF